MDSGLPKYQTDSHDYTARRCLFTADGGSGVVVADTGSDTVEFVGGDSVGWASLGKPGESSMGPQPWFWCLALGW